MGLVPVSFPVLLPLGFPLLRISHPRRACPEEISCSFPVVGTHLLFHLGRNSGTPLVLSRLPGPGVDPTGFKLCLGGLWWEKHSSGCVQPVCTAMYMNTYKYLWGTLACSAFITCRLLQVSLQLKRFQNTFKTHPLSHPEKEVS